MFDRFAEFIAFNRILVSRIFSVAFLLAMILSTSVHDGTFMEGLLFMLGLILIGIATTGRLWCSLYISGYKDAQIITEGPYSLTRNPLYFFSLLGFVGLGFATETFTVPIVFLTVYLLGYRGVIRKEESFLREKFGSIYEDYCTKTPRFFPSLSAFAEPATYTVCPKVFRRAMGDVLWFVWLVGIIEFVEVFHDSGLIRPLFYLY